MNGWIKIKKTCSTTMCSSVKATITICYWMFARKSISRINLVYCLCFVFISYLAVPETISSSQWHSLKTVMTVLKLVWYFVLPRVWCISVTCRKCHAASRMCHVTCHDTSWSVAWQHQFLKTVANIHEMFVNQTKKYFFMYFPQQQQVKARDVRVTQKYFPCCQ